MIHHYLHLLIHRWRLTLVEILSSSSRSSFQTNLLLISKPKYELIFNYIFHLFLTFSKILVIFVLMRALRHPTPRLCFQVSTFFLGRKILKLSSIDTFPHSLTQSRVTTFQAQQYFEKFSYHFCLTVWYTHLIIVKFFLMIITIEIANIPRRKAKKISYKKPTQQHKHIRHKIWNFLPLNLSLLVRKVHFLTKNIIYTIV